MGGKTNNSVQYPSYKAEEEYQNTIYCENSFLVRISQFLRLAFKSQSKLRLALEIHTSAMIGSVRTSRPVSRDRHTLQPNCCNSYTLEEFRQLNFILRSGNIPTCHTGRLAGQKSLFLPGPLHGETIPSSPSSQAGT